MIKLILAEAAPAADMSSWMMIGFLVVCIVGMYIFSSRSQKKRQAKVDAMIAGLEVGSKIKTIGGILGVIEVITEDAFIIKTGEGDKSGYMKIVKNAVYAADESSVSTGTKAKAKETTEVIEVQDEENL